LAAQGRDYNPLVSIIIPHIGPVEILNSCLNSIRKINYPNYQIIIVDNSTKLDPKSLSGYVSNLIFIHNEENLGFAGGCNIGIKKAEGDYVVLLNNDTIVDTNWLGPLVETMEGNANIAACQSRLLSLTNKGKFDYAGAMGGLIDIFGYPFAIGRIFDSLEDDKNNYLENFEVFWTSGCSSIWRKSALDEVGLFDEDFFAHMEEIDLNWRLHLRGYRSCSNFESKVYHHSGYSLGYENWRKMFLNHRNNLVLLLKNYQLKSLLWIYPLRIVMEIVTGILFLFLLNWKRSFAVLMAQLYVIKHLAKILKKHKAIQSLRTVQDSQLFEQMFWGSIVWQYYLRRKRIVSEFLKVKSINEKSSTI